MQKTVEEINAKIRKGKAVVLTADEIVDLVKEHGVKRAFQQVDVVTTGTFAPMCSSGALLNTGHTRPRMNFKRAWLNDVEAYCGIAAIDLYLGATAVPENDPRNQVFPGKFTYGGGHVIEDLVAGRDVLFRATSYGSNCYPRKELTSWIKLKDLPSAWLLNPRNCYQNYNVAVNARSPKLIYTYMGLLRPKMANANYCSAGQLSPLLKDPHYRTIGIGTRVFLGGGVGYVAFPGTQHNPTVERTKHGVPKSGAGTLALIGDLKAMKPHFIRGVSMTGYGPSLALGVGIPIPLLNEEITATAALPDEELVAPVWDYGHDYPERSGEPLGYVSYAELRTGQIKLQGKTIPTASLSSLPMAREVAATLKDWIVSGRFLLSQPVELLPGENSGVGFHPFVERPPERPASRRRR
jgi:uncharacterized protein (DUF39 family)